MDIYLAMFKLPLMAALLGRTSTLMEEFTKIYILKLIAPLAMAPSISAVSILVKPMLPKIIPLPKV
jgi:hypothetical protein